VAPTMSKSSP